MNVNSTADILNPANGIVTLRSAIQQANASANPDGTVINLTVPGTYQITLQGTAGETDNAAGEFAIVPTGTPLSIINTSGARVTVDGGGHNRVLDINPNNAATKELVTFQGFIIQDGFATDANNPDGFTASGGGIRDQGNISLTLNNIVLTNNAASADGGGISMENTVSSPWTLTLDNTTVRHNHAGDAGGGLETDGSGKVFINNSTITGNTTVNQGAGIWLDAIQAGTVLQSANLTITGSVISDNTALNGPTGGIGNAGNGAVSITSSTTANNFSGGTTSGGGGFGDENNQGTLTVLNSTFVDNSTTLSGGAIQEGGPSTTILDSTFTGNSSLVSGGGLFIQSPQFMLNNSIVAGNLTGPLNFAGGMGPDVFATVTSGNGNFIGAADANLVGITNGTNRNQIGTLAAPLNPLLSPLENHGGPTPTEDPLPGSPVIGMGVFGVLPTGTTTDQRGFPRTINGMVDIGAVQFQNIMLAVSVTPATPTVVINNTDSLTIRVTNTGGDALPADGSTVTVALPSGLTLAGTPLAFSLGALGAGQAAAFHVSVTGTALGPQIVRAIVSSPDTAQAAITASGTVTVVLHTSSATSVSSSPNPSVVGQAVTFTATLSVGPGAPTPTGTVDFREGNTDLTPGGVTLSGKQATFSTSALGAAKHIITAIYSGDSNVIGSQGDDAASPQVVNKATSRTVLTAFPNPAVFGQMIAFTVAVSSLSPGSGTPTGTVTFIDGTTTIGSVTLSNGGRATFTTASLSRGNHAIRASFSGDGRFLASANSNFGAVVQKDTTTATETATANPVVVGHTLTLTATVQANLPGSGSPTGTVTFKDITTVLGTATLNAAGLATFTTSTLAVGTHALTVTYAGDTNFASSFSPNIAEVVTASGATTLLSPLPTDSNEVLTALTEIQPDPGRGPTAQRVDDFFSGGGRGTNMIFSVERNSAPAVLRGSGRSPYMIVARDAIYEVWTGEFAVTASAAS
jgi:hypothetical protein